MQEITNWLDASMMTLLDHFGKDSFNVTVLFDGERKFRDCLLLFTMYYMSARFFFG